MKEVTVYTDGACSGNPGAGGWGTILDYMGKRKELCGGEALTTNNRMELTAVIEGLKALKEPCKVKIVTDSQYVSNGITLGWAKSWRANGWLKKDKKPALNSELWEELLNLIEKHDVTIEWIRGHAGHAENERCDQLAVMQSKKFSQVNG
ncbi:MAG: ribonuclease HI [Acutalibacteraceae bacterium]